MPKKLFISYRHSKQDWVKRDLVPVLDAGGADVLVDYRFMKAGKQIIGQMDDQQDDADMTIAVVTPDYLESEACIHELDRAMEAQRKFDTDEPRLIVLKMSDIGLPESLEGLHGDYVPDFTDPRDPAQWKLLTDAADCGLGVAVPSWLKARDEIVQLLERQVSVNLVISGKYIKWKELLTHLQKDFFPQMGDVDLQSGAVNSRKALISEILKECGLPTAVPDPPDDLVVLDSKLNKKDFSRLIFKHFDMISNRENYNHPELFAALRFLIQESRKLNVLIHSRQPFQALLPEDHILSSITNLQVVELAAGT